MLTDKSKCTGCGACAQVCAKKAIEMVQFEDGFLYPEINKDLCVNCGLCEAVCPIDSPKNQIERKTAFAVKNLDSQVRLASSSGGAFWAYACKILENGGVCIGAALDEDMTIRHVVCETQRQTDRLRGSKYAQSITGDIFLKTKKLLLEGKQVLFSGTPCQVAALKSFLGKNYENLITIDFICHGTPSQVLWKSYIDYMQRKSGKKITDANFRDKTDGWKNFSMKLEYDNKESVYLERKDERYLKAFLYNVFLRPSCYGCQFKGDNYRSDITLADFWSIDRVMPKINDDKGVSLLIVNTKAGREITEQVKSQFETFEIDTQPISSLNVSYNKCAPKTALNRCGLKDTTKLSFEKLFNKYCKENFQGKMKRKIARTLVKKG